MRTLAACAFAAALVASAQAEPSDLGALDFPTSGSPEAQQHFLRGVAALHSFWYEEAERSFRRAREVEPGFAMAYWGEALSHNHPLWEEQDLQAARAVLAKLGETRNERLAKVPSERERGYLEAVEILFGAGEKHERDVRYAAAMRQLSERFPEDREAAAFHALALLGTVERGDRGFRRQMRAAAILEPIFRANPDHPGAAHYLIHSYDDPDHAPLGLPAAERYAEIAPAAHHALHMPTHIFVQLGMWERVASSNRRAYDASDAWVKREKLSLSKRDFHSLSWLQYAQLQLGRYAEAKATVEEMRASARETGDPRSLRYGEEMAARQLLETGDWAASESLAAVRDDAANDTKGDVEPRAQALTALGVAAARGGDAAAALTYADRLQALRRAQEEAGRSYRARAIAVSEHELRAVALVASGQAEAALEQARLAAETEASLDPPSGPPVPVKPAGELYAELLLETGKAADAEAQFRAALERIPGRAAARLGLARAVARQGRKAEAAVLYADLLKTWQHADQTLPAVVEARAAASEEVRGE